MGRTTGARRDSVPGALVGTLFPHQGASRCADATTDSGAELWQAVGPPEGMAEACRETLL
jgi:hypothetical protein